MLREEGITFDPEKAGYTDQEGNLLDIDIQKIIEEYVQHMEKAYKLIQAREAGTSSVIESRADTRSFASNITSLRPKSALGSHYSKDRYSRVTALELDLLKERQARHELEQEMSKIKDLSS